MIIIHCPPQLSLKEKNQIQRTLVRVDLDERDYCDALDKLLEVKELEFWDRVIPSLACLLSQSRLPHLQFRSLQCLMEYVEMSPLSPDLPCLVNGNVIEIVLNLIQNEENSKPSPFLWLLLGFIQQTDRLRQQWADANCLKRIVMKYNGESLAIFHQKFVSTINVVMNSTIISPDDEDYDKFLAKLYEMLQFGLQTYDEFFINSNILPCVEHLLMSNHASQFNANLFEKIAYVLTRKNIYKSTEEQCLRIFILALEKNTQSDVLLTICNLDDQENAKQNTFLKTLGNVLKKYEKQIHHNNYQHGMQIINIIAYMSNMGKSEKSNLNLYGIPLVFCN